MKKHFGNVSNNGIKIFLSKTLNQLSCISIIFRKKLVLKIKFPIADGGKVG
ncbi:MAG: hypothetical protein WHT45_12660 [Ignavibacterium sp.]